MLGMRPSKYGVKLQIFRPCHLFYIQIPCPDSQTLSPYIAAPPSKAIYHPATNLHALNGSACNLIAVGLMYSTKVITPMITHTTLVM